MKTKELREAIEGFVLMVIVTIGLPWLFAIFNEIIR